MSKPNFNEERKLWKKGIAFVVGIDEAGRGPLAGPVIACAITFPEFPISNFQFSKIKDSKKLSAKKREEIYKLLKKNPDVKWGIGRVSEKVIDKINILQATKLAMKRAVKNLDKKVTESLSVKSDSVTFLLIDGNFGIDLDFPQKSIIKGDQKVFSCAAASIIAKVSRDRMMIKYHDKYPEYGFNRHKGYGTKLHRKAVKKYGFCDIHRKTFHVS
ncbi:ribonuclease HII [Patescibacteria group bacterium]|nr:ribonuclease HII [Patescibacteria group bacterium]